jgi:hypothetical protein
MHNIMEDAIVRIRSLKTMGAVAGQGREGAASSASKHGILDRDALMCSRSLWTMELELPDFKVVTFSEGLKEWCMQVCC